MSENRMTLARLGEGQKAFHTFINSSRFDILQAEAKKIGFRLNFMNYSVPYRGQLPGDLAWNVYEVTIVKNSAHRDFSAVVALSCKTYNDFGPPQMQNLVWWIENNLNELQLHLH